MALSASIVWEARSSATAGNLNGGGFKTGATGTDYSQQDAAQYSPTGLTTAGISATIAYASASSDMVGNLIHIVSGTNFTPGWYEIISVVVGVSITVDRNCTTGAGASGVGYIGGALSLGSSDDAVFESMVAGNTMWVKNGTYTLGGGVSVASAGTLANVINLKGYNSIRGDNPTGTNRPLLDGGSNFIAFGSYWNIYNLRFRSNAAAGSYTMILNANSKIFNCQLRNYGGGTAMWMYGATHAQGCEFSSYGYGQYGVQAQSYNVLVGCYFNNCDTGILMPTAFPIAVIGCIFNNCKTVGIDFTSTNAGGSIVYGCTFYGSEAKIGIGIRMAAGTLALKVLNCIFYGLTTGMSHGASQTENYGDYNNYYNCTTTLTNMPAGPNDRAVDPGFTAVSQLTGTTATTSGGQLVDSGADFSTVTDNQSFLHVLSGTGVTAGLYLITSHSSTTLTTSPALSNNATANKVYSIGKGFNWAIGTNLKGLGMPAAFDGSSTTSSPDIGAVQRAEAAASVDPGVANVRSGTAYTIDGSSKTGTLVVPTASQVKTGVVFESSGGTTGTYDGSDRWTDPGESNVRSGTAYKANSTTNNKTGTAAIPTAANVRYGTATDATTGTLVVPSASDVRSGVTFDATTVGTLDVDQDNVTVEVEDYESITVTVEDQP